MGPRLEEGLPLALLNSLKKVARLGDLVIPKECAVCAAPLGAAGGTLCAPCAMNLAENVAGEYCIGCGREVGGFLLENGRCTPCREPKPRHLRFSRFVRVGRYDGSLRNLILQFKQKFYLDRFLGDLLGDAIRGAIDPDAVDLWIPIPSHWFRRWQRGFQPTALLAAAALRAIGRAPSEALRMSRHVSEFHSRDRLSFAQRAEAIHGAFRVCPEMDVREKRVMLIDDVMTTGATMAEAVRTLRKAGAARIGAAVLAKTGPAAGVDRVRRPA